MVWPSRFHIYPVYTEQKLSESRSGSRSRLRSGSRPEDVLVHTGHAYSIQQSASYCCSLFSHCYIVDNPDRNPDRVFTPN